MKSNSKTPDEYTNFENALKTVLSVPRSEMLRREEEYKRERAAQKKKRKSKTSASRASNDKD